MVKEFGVLFGQIECFRQEQKILKNKIILVELVWNKLDVSIRINEGEEFLGFHNGVMTRNVCCYLAI